jgi:hypothetical protein
VYRDEKCKTFILKNTDFFLTLNAFRDESFNFSSYNKEYHVKRSEIYSPVDSNV